MILDVTMLIVSSNQDIYFKYLIFKFELWFNIYKLFTIDILYKYCQIQALKNQNEDQTMTLYLSLYV